MLLGSGIFRLFRRAATAFISLDNRTVGKARLFDEMLTCSPREPTRRSAHELIAVVTLDEAGRGAVRRRGPG